MCCYLVPRSITSKFCPNLFQIVAFIKKSWLQNYHLFLLKIMTENIVTNKAVTISMRPSI